MASRKLLKALFLFLLIPVFAMALPKKTLVRFKHGSKITYAVDNRGKSYNLIITIVKTSPDLEFSYELTAPFNKKGSITIKAKDLDSARSLHNDFMGGSLTLKGEVSLFLSRILYAETCMAGMNEGGTWFQANTNEAMDTFSTGEQIKKDIKINGRTVSIDADKIFDHVDDQTGSYHYTITVLRNENFPLILDMNLGLSLAIKSMDDVEVYQED